MIGQTISHYKILEKLGEGGMGVVYKAEDTKLHRIVALKFLPPEFTRDKEAKKRFIQEAQAASSLQHHNVCTIHDIDETDNKQIFICMDYYEGETLKEKIRKGFLNTEEVINIAIQIAEGLQSAHERGIIHRDIKPANIFITKNEEIKILDFGLAKLSKQSAITKVGLTVGTMAYMSPEQARGDDINFQTDIWSIAVVLFEMLTGELPFKGDYEQAILYSILNEEPDSVSRILNDIPANLEFVIHKALQKNRKKRYESLNEMLDDLQAIVKNLKVTQDGFNENPLPSIAVLPFVNMSADPENEYFSDGITEDIINAVSKIKDFHVAARTSTFSFKGEKIDIYEIGKKLKVKTILEGSVRKAGNRLRITAQLINVQDGYHLWSEQYDRVAAYVFDIQDEITFAIVNALKIKLLTGENIAVTKRYTDNIEAYNLYSKGRYYWNKMNIEAFGKAIDQFQKAIALDPSYALAYSGLADAYTGLGDAGLSAIPPKEAFSKAKEAVQKALDIDEALAEAHASLAHLNMHDFNWSGAELEFKHAIKLNPNYSTTYQMCAFYYALTRRFNDAFITIKKAQDLDPISLSINTDLGVLFYFNHQYDKAIAQYEKTLDLDPGFIRAYVTLGSAYGKNGMCKIAIEMIHKAIELSGDRAKIAVLGRIFAIAGKKREALKAIEELKELSKQRYISSYCISLIYASMNEKDQAMEWLENAYDEHASELIYLKVDPYLDNMRSDPRFKELLKKIGLANDIQNHLPL
jgi:serine/threonine protein kinase/Tfp pilus assembly protein PilF